MKVEFSRRILETFSNIKFIENPSIGSWVVPYGRTDGHKGRLQTDTTWLIVAFCNFANAPQRILFFLHTFYLYFLYDSRSWSRWPLGLWRGSSAAHILGLWAIIPPEAWISYSC